MKLRRISSLLTFFNKIVVPLLTPVWLALLFVWWIPARSPWWFYGAMIAAAAVTIWHSWGVKWVAIDEMNSRLYVSNYRKEISIPLSHIVDVKESIWSDPRRVKITLSEPSEFGDKVLFFATYRFGGILAGPHPIVNELIALAAKAQGSRF